MEYAIVRMFPEATRQNLEVGDAFVPANRESAGALMRAGMLRATIDSSPSKSSNKHQGNGANATRRMRR